MTQPGAPIVRRLTLPAELRSPGAARSLVRSVAAEAGLDDHLDEALLLTTELVTNAVLHAGTEVTVEVLADTSGLTITVLDGLPGPLLGDAYPVARRPTSERRARPRPAAGRPARRPLGHRPPRGPARASGSTCRAGTRASRTRSSRGRPSTRWPSSARITEGAELPDQLEELLRRLAHATGASGAAVLVDDGESAGPRDHRDVRHRPSRPTAAAPGCRCA